MTPPSPAPDPTDEATLESAGPPPVVLERPLGCGRTSRVWQARSTAAWGHFPTGTRFAAKILRADLVDDADAVLTLRSESKASRFLRDAGLARTRFASFEGRTPPLDADTDVKDLGDAANDASVRRPWLLLDLVPGVALDEEIAELGAFAEPAVRAIGVRLARTLGAMHAAGWAHGDVKPDNVRLDEKGRAVLVDLGFARPVDAPDAPLGTPTYLAPERVRGGPAAASADLFALGCVLYEVSVGAPAAGEPPDLDALRNGGVLPPSDSVPRVSPLLDAIVLELLSPSPAARPTAATVADALEQGEASEWWRAHLRRETGTQHPMSTWAGRHGLPMVGRGVELEALAAAWEEARTAGTAVVLTGERGMGKSRLVTEFVHTTRRKETEPPVYLYGRCDAVEDERPGAPLIALLRRWLHLPSEAHPGPRSRALLEEALPADIARTLLAMLDPDAEGHDGAEVTEAAALGEWLLRLGRETPTIVFLDDVNFAGSATLTALQRVARELEQTRLLLVLGLRQRSEVRNVASLSELRSRLSNRTHRIDVGPLNADEVLRLVEQIFHHSTARLRLARTLHERTGGVPGSIGELLRLAAQRGWTRPVAPPGRGLELLIPPDELPRPESIRVAVTDRLAELDGRARIWLERVAVVGGRIDPALVARAWPRSGAARRDAAFARLVRLGWLVAAGPRYKFAEPVEREETLEQIAPRRLTRTHHAVARALAEEETAGQRMPSFRRAFHLREAKAHSEQLEILPELVQRMQTAGHPHRRATLAGWGLEALDATSAAGGRVDLRRPFLEALADAADRLGERREQRAALEELSELDIDAKAYPAAAAHIYLLHARHAIGSGQLGLARGFLRNARNLAERAEKMTTSHQDELLLAADRAEIERLFGHLAAELGEYTTASRHATVALGLAPDAVSRARARLVQAEVEIHEGRPEAALRRLAAARRELRRASGSLDARAARATSSLLAGRAWRVVGRPYRAARSFERAAELALQAGEGRIEVEVAARRGRLLADVGREHEAELSLRDGLFAARRIEDRRGEAITSLFLGTLLAEQGTSGAGDLVRRALRLAQEMGLVRIVSLTLAIEARLARESGDASRALSKSQTAYELLERHGAELPDRIVIAATRAFVLSESGRTKESIRIRRALERRIDADNARLHSPLLKRRQRRWTLSLLASAMSPDGPLYPRVALPDWPS